MNVYFKFVVLLLLHLVSSEKTKRPHIILIVADDLGWNDVSFHGSYEIPTPNIDSLAADGIILNNYYVSSICTPSRGSLLTGKHPVRLGLQHYVIDGDTPWGLPTEEKTMAQYLKDLGYVTHGIGKWHLGFFNCSYLPTNRGFDSFFGYWTGKKDYYTHFSLLRDMNGLDLHDSEENSWGYNGYYSTELFTDKAKALIKKHKSSKPLFLYLAYQAVHGANSYSPLQAPPEYVNKFTYIKDKDRRTFAGMVSVLDWSVGEIFTALDKAHLLNDSLIIFTTDNGGAVQGIDGSTGSNWPLRGSKYNMWEGGVRGISWMWSANLRNHSYVATQMMHISDWLPTLYAAAGGDVNNLTDLDGYNMWPAILHNKSSPRHEILHNIDPVWKVEGIRKNQYKLLKGSVFNGQFDGWFGKDGKRTVDNNETYSKLDQKKFITIAKKFLKQSTVAKILERKYGKYEVKSQYFQKNSKVEVKCGKKPKNASDSCKPLILECLFNVEEDPCEYHNIAEKYPKVVEELKRLLDVYRSKAVPPRNQLSDPASNPKFHNYSWVPWKSKK